MSSVAKIAPGGYRLFLGKPARLALTRLLADKPELSQGKAINQLVELGLCQLGYLVDPTKCQHDYAWLSIPNSLAKRYACRNCLERPHGDLAKNILFAPGLEPVRETGQSVPFGIALSPNKGGIGGIPNTNGQFDVGEEPDPDPVELEPVEEVAVE